MRFEEHLPQCCNCLPPPWVLRNQCRAWADGGYRGIPGCPTLHQHQIKKTYHLNLFSSIINETPHNWGSRCPRFSQTLVKFSKRHTKFPFSLGMGSKAVHVSQSFALVWERVGGGLGGKVEHHQNEGQIWVDQFYPTPTSTTEVKDLRFVMTNYTPSKREPLMEIICTKLSWSQYVSPFSKWRRQKCDNNPDKDLPTPSVSGSVKLVPLNTLWRSKMGPRPIPKRHHWLVLVTLPLDAAAWRCRWRSVWV